MTKLTNQENLSTMLFDRAAVATLPQEQVLRLIDEANPTASSS